LPQFLIGRDPECHLRPVSPLVSKRHCALLVKDDKAFIRDFGSTNGSLVNGKQVQGEVELHDGDELRLGPLHFRVKLEPTSQVARPSSSDTISDEVSTTATHPAARPSSAAVKPAKKSANEEDLVAEMLFNLGGDDGASTANKDQVPVDTTIMTNMTAEGGSGENGEAPKPAEKSAKVKIDHQATANAAKAILEKYMKRPRT
jgi:pSer/pThr/pTyr-binding forkhead associated (FHA) protein